MDISKCDIWIILGKLETDIMRESRDLGQFFDMLIYLNTSGEVISALADYGCDYGLEGWGESLEE